MSEGQGTCTREEVVKFMAAVCQHISSQGVAQSAIQAGLAAAGWQGLQPALASVLTSQPAKQPAGKKGKAKEAKAEGKKDRKPRGLTAMNMFSSYLLHTVSKDPNNPKYKLPDTVDADGNTVPTKGGSMVFSAACWKALSESEKGRFLSIVQPVLEDINNGMVESGARISGQDALAKMQEHLREHRQEAELNSLIDSTVVRATGKGGHGTPAAGAKTAATPASNGAAQKEAKKRKKEKEEEKDKKKAKKEDKKDGKKKKEEDKKKKKAPSPSDSSSGEDSDSEAGAPQHKVASAKKAASSSDSSDSSSEEDSD